MNKDATYSIVSDVTCDIDLDTRKKIGLDIVDGYITVDGKEMCSSIDWGKYYTVREFYDWIRAGKKVTSSQTPPQDFIPFFEEKLQKGLDVLYIGCSSAMSSTVFSGVTAAEQLKEKYPDRKIIVIDALRASAGLAVLLYKAFELQAEGKTIDETAEWITEHRNNVHQVGTVESLSYLKRAGRINSMTAIMGTLIGIKPIIIADTLGANVSVAKAHGSKAAFRKCIEYVKETIENPEEQYIYISHSDCLETVETVEKMLLEAVKCKGVVISCVNPSMGHCVGPGMFGIYYFGKKVTLVSKK